MRAPIIAILVAGSAIVFPAMAQQQQPGDQKAAPSEQTPQQMHQDKDKAMKPEGGQTSQQTVPPGQSLNDQTTGSNSQTSGSKAYGK